MRRQRSAARLSGRLYTLSASRCRGADTHCISAGVTSCPTTAAPPPAIAPLPSSQCAATGARLKEARTVRESRMPNRPSTLAGIGRGGTSANFRARMRSFAMLSVANVPETPTNSRVCCTSCPSSTSLHTEASTLAHVYVPLKTPQIRRNDGFETKVSGCVWKVITDLLTESMIRMLPAAFFMMALSMVETNGAMQRDTDTAVATSASRIFAEGIPRR
mmetsp:Transcript_74556/g.218568  ORF Transcript_74556/g.218568 Transcript_74556/m.218568 type:complete len:218 (+) Transcript_74556:405-1058(+)